MRRHLAIVPAKSQPSLEPGSAGVPSASAPAPARTGLAVIGPSRVLRTALSGRHGSDLGVLTHALVSTHAPLLVSSLDREDLLPRLNAMARGLLDANWNRRRVVAAEAVSLAHKYLTRIAPSSPWRLLGVEVETGDGVVDLAWEHEDGRVVFDELKTTRVATSKVPEDWLGQVRRYAAAGAAQHAGSFTGVRLLPLNRMHLARLVAASGRIVRLSPTTSEPLSEKGGDA